MFVLFPYLTYFISLMLLIYFPATVYQHYQDPSAQPLMWTTRGKRAANSVLASLALLFVSVVIALDDGNAGLAIALPIISAVWLGCWSMLFKKRYSPAPS
jgi:UDP-N-acetylmuramyl pentapeptide phosphotransferase/UDP-N-acetylglucosamine-1-phosphate transferase